MAKCANPECGVGVAHGTGYMAAIESRLPEVLSRPDYPLQPLTKEALHRAFGEQHEHEQLPLYCSWDCVKTLDDLPVFVAFMPLFVRAVLVGGD